MSVSECGWGSSLIGRRNCMTESPMENLSNKVIWCGYTALQSIVVNQGSYIGLGQGLTVLSSAYLMPYIAYTILRSVGNKYWSILIGLSLAPRTFDCKRISLQHSSLFSNQYIHDLLEPTLSYWTFTPVLLTRVHRRENRVHRRENRVHRRETQVHRRENRVHRRDTANLQQLWSRLLFNLTCLHPGIHDVIGRLRSV